jgi:CRP-like cAMP-binding protein
MKGFREAESIMEKMEFLGNVSIFSHMKDADLNRIAGLARYQVFEEGDVIITEGKRDGRLFVVLSGEVEVIKGLGLKHRSLLRKLGPYSYFGEMALIDDMVRSASVVAIKKSRILYLEKYNLVQEIEKYPALGIEMLQMLSRRIRAIEKSMKNVLGTLLPICANCKKIREDNGSWVPIENYITDHSESEFTHGICPQCAERLYPELHKGDQAGGRPAVHGS